MLLHCVKYNIEYMLFKIDKINQNDKIHYKAINGDQFVSVVRNTGYRGALDTLKHFKCVLKILAHCLRICETL